MWKSAGLLALCLLLWTGNGPALIGEELYPYDEHLKCAGNRCNTLGPTGRRLFADRLEGAPGFCGVFGYCHTTPEFQDPMVITFNRLDGPPLDLEEESTTWFPSHLRTVWKGDGIRVAEKKCITEDDEFLVQVRVTNLSDAPLDLEVYLKGGQTPLVERLRSQQISVDLSGKTNLSPLGLARSALEEGAPAPRSLHASVLYDSITYHLPDPGPESRATLVALKGGREEGPGFKLPDRVSLPLPDLKPAIAHLNLLVTAPAVNRVQGIGSPAFFLFHFDDNSSEQVAWPSPSSGRNEMDGQASDSLQAQRMQWRRLALPNMAALLMQLTYTPPPGRFLQQVELVKDSGDALPTLLAATFEVPPREGRMPVLLGEPNFHGHPVHMVLAGHGFIPGRNPAGERSLLRTLNLEPEASLSFNALLASGPKQFPLLMTSQDRVRDSGAFEKHVKQYHAWFDAQAPAFTCSDLLMEKAWHYRWFLTRHNMVRLDVPDLSLPVFYQSLHDDAATWVNPFASSPILGEVRWLRDRRFAQGQVRAFLKNQYPDGRLPSLRVGQRTPGPIHWIPAASMEAFKVNASLQYLKETLPLLSRNVEANLKILDPDGNFLPAFTDQEQSGMPWLPSSFLLNGDGNRGPADCLERPDHAAYLHASALAVAEGHRYLGNFEEGARFEVMAMEIARAVLRLMWDEEDAFFYALRSSDHAQVRCREITGLYPFFARLVPDAPDYLSALDRVMDRSIFWTPYPVTAATSDRSAPLYIQPRPGEALWLAPLFPHANSVMAEVLAHGIRHYTNSALTGEQFTHFLQQYTRLHFREGRGSYPMVREFHRADTGKGFGCLDSFQSTYNDLLIRFVGGLVPSTEDAILLQPLVKHLEHFSFRNIPYHGRSLDILWDRPDGKNIHPPAPEGYSLWVDGKMAAHEIDLMKIWSSL